MDYLARVHAGEWFKGAGGRNELERTFLGSLRALAAEALANLIDVAATTSSTVLTPVHLGIDVPSLPEAGTGWPGSLQAAYFPTGTPAGPRLQGEWSLGGYVMDGNGDPHDLDEALTAQPGDEPVVAATLVLKWLVEQLRRPIERLGWSPGTAAERSLWRLADTGSELRRSGRWLLHRAAEPDTATAIR